MSGRIASIHLQYVAQAETRKRGVLGSPRVSRAGERVLAMADFLLRSTESQLRSFLETSFRRDAETSTRDACATQSSAHGARELLITDH
ncbi:MAG: hypothetical protein ACREFF_08820 [Candidatus Udaeobacter sp.]